jgi:hypothetical protein
MELAGILNDVVAVCEASPQNVDWAGYEDQSELLEDLRQHIRRLRTGDLRGLSDLRVLFLPTGPLQDIAIDSGWHEIYLVLASRFDEAYRRQIHEG